VLNDFESGKTVQVIRPTWSRPTGCNFAVWHPNGRRLFVAAGDNNEVQEYLFDPAARERRPARLLHTHPVGGGNIIWDAPAYPPEPEGPAPLPAPLQLTVAGGDLLSDPAKLRAYERELTSRRLAADPKDLQANLAQARSLMEANRHAEALYHLELALERHPGSYAVPMNKGLCLIQLGRVK
jgi:hypothetical protein